jgi:hypothetical protein
MKSDLAYDRTICTANDYQKLDIALKGNKPIYLDIRPLQDSGFLRCTIRFSNPIRHHECSIFLDKDGYTYIDQYKALYLEFIDNCYEVLKYVSSDRKMPQPSYLKSVGYTQLDPSDYKEAKAFRERFIDCTEINSFISSLHATNKDLNKHF